MKRVVIIASLFALVVPAAFAAPPPDNGKPDSPGASASAPGQSPTQNAAKACKAERTTMGEQAFKNKYGTNKNKANAFGKCVSARAKASTAEQNAAKKCAAELASIGAQAFKNKYGTNTNKANAFGKCVSALAKQQQGG